MSAYSYLGLLAMCIIRIRLNNKRGYFLERGGAVKWLLSNQDSKCAVNVTFGRFF